VDNSAGEVISVPKYVVADDFRNFVDSSVNYFVKATISMLGN